jgi:hypothetical protein
MTEIGHFEAVNDRFGQAAGRVPQAVPRSARRNATPMRPLLSRQRVMLPQTVDTAAVQFSERLRRPFHGRASCVEERQVSSHD